jgi:hypothetical protein
LFLSVVLEASGKKRGRNVYLSCGEKRGGGLVGEGRAFAENGRSARSLYNNAPSS